MVYLCQKVGVAERWQDLCSALSSREGVGLFAIILDSRLVMHKIRSSRKLFKMHIAILYFEIG
jgi:hypothetical protein